MREGTGEAMAAVARDAAFAYLADPRHAPEWFAGVQFSGELESEPHAGMEWRFIQVQSGNRVVPVRMVAYEPPSHFAWQTALRWPRTNLRWEMRCERDKPAGKRTEATRLRITVRIEPGPLGWLALWLSPRAYRPNPATQAQRAVERARDMLLGRFGSSQARRPPEKRRRRR